ncbi:MAG: PAC2 family protein [Desulfobacterales bacterium]|nr:PAC2 family protein [Desulfobacterales bacterium]
MDEKGIYLEHLPELKEPVFIAGFDGWGNALDVSKAMVSYLIRELDAEYLAKINPELFYQYDVSRPFVNLENGKLKSIAPPGGSFYAVRNGLKGSDLIILKANEPNLRWNYFSNELFSLCEQFGVKTIITIGSMYDNVLHSDRIISGIASNKALFSKLKQMDVLPISYNGPSGIHSTLHSEGQKRGFQCLSLWGHCPYYLQGTTHFGLLSRIGAILSFLGDFEVGMEELEKSWKELNKQIQRIIEDNEELRNIVNELRREQVRGSWASLKDSEKKNGNVIDLQDFLKPR